MLLWQRLLGEANTRTNSAPIGLCLEYLLYLLVPILYHAFQPHHLADQHSIEYHTDRIRRVLEFCIDRVYGESPVGRGEIVNAVHISGCAWVSIWPLVWSDILQRAD